MYELRGVTPRIKDLADKVRNRVVRVDAERTVIMTEAYKKYEKMPPIIKIPMALKDACELATVKIEDFEIVAGAKGQHFMGTGMPPCWSDVFWVIDCCDSGEWSLDEDGIYHNPADEDGFEVTISKEDLELYRECKPYWIDQQNSISAMAETFQPDGFKEKYQELECSDYFPGMPLMICATGHLTAGFKKIIDVGYAAIRKQAQDWMDAHEGNLMGDDVNKYMFYKSTAIACDAAITLIDRYAAEAARMAAECTDANRKAELEMMADGFAWIARNPARSYWEACEAVIMYQLVLCFNDGWSPSCSLGRFDQYTWPYLKRDLDAGKLTLDQAQEITDAFFLKVNGFYAPGFPKQAKVSGIGTTYYHTTIGGVDPDTGEDASNPVTYMVLETLGRLELHDPTISLRVNDNTPEDLWELALITSKRVGGLPLFQNDELIIPSLQEEMGFTLHDARDFSLIGCQEIVGSGCDYPAPCGVHPPHASIWFGVILDMAINDGINPKNGKQAPEAVRSGYLYDMGGFEEVWDAYEKLVRYCMNWQITMNNYTEYISMWVAPQAALSISMDDCMERGVDAAAGGCRYNSYGGTAPGLATVADSLTTIKYMCFDKKLCTTRELYDAVMANWEGYEELRQRIINQVPHYGNDDEYADAIYKRVVDLYVDACDHGYSTRSKKYKAGMYGASDHIAQGYRTWATPDGRHTDDPLADAASPAQGRDHGGPTAIFNSACCYDQSRFMDGMALNVRMHPSAVAHEDGLRKLRDLTRTYFDRGGMEVQYNIVDTETLRAAQENPDDYRNLVVRIAGYSAYFVEMADDLQNDIISRTENRM